MKLVTTSKGIGRLADDDVIDLLDVPYPDLGGLLMAGESLASLSNASTSAQVRRSDTKVLSPILVPRHLWAVGLNYAAHVVEINGAALSEPYIFPKAPGAIIGDGDAIALPAVSPSQVDYEGEMALVIGRYARHLSAADAWSCVAGITICNDVSARDLQKGSPGVRSNISLAKSFETFAPIGPCVVPLEDIDDPSDLHLQTFVSDELRQDARTSEMIFSVPVLLEYLTARVALYPGDIVSTGTPEGVGDVDGRFLKDGDVVRIELEGIGTLTNPVVAY